MVSQDSNALASRLLNSRMRNQEPGPVPAGYYFEAWWHRRMAIDAKVGVACITK